jgi:hypothetical protein
MATTATVTATTMTTTTIEAQRGPAAKVPARVRFVRGAASGRHRSAPVSPSRHMPRVCLAGPPLSRVSRSGQRFADALTSACGAFLSDAYDGNGET